MSKALNAPGFNKKQELLQLIFADNYIKLCSMTEKELIKASKGLPDDTPLDDLYIDCLDRKRGIFADIDFILNEQILLRVLKDMDKIVICQI